MADCIPIQHRVLTLGDIHGIANWQFATEQNRQDFAGPFVATDLHKVAYVQETQQYYILNSISPIGWANFSVPTISAVSYNTVARQLEISMSDGAIFTTSLQDIYTFATNAASTAAGNAVSIAVTTANNYTDQQIAIVNNAINALSTTVLELAGMIRPLPKTVTANYTILPEDHNRLIVVNSASDVVITIPDEATESLGDGFVCTVDRQGVGNVDFATTGGDVLQYAGTAARIDAQFAAATIVQKELDDGTNVTTWGLYGRLPQ